MTSFTTKNKIGRFFDLSAGLVIDIRIKSLSDEQIIGMLQRDWKNQIKFALEEKGSKIRENRIRHIPYTRHR